MPSVTDNDENVLVIRGDKRVADIYFGEFMRLFAHHRFRESVKRHLDEIQGAPDTAVMTESEKAAPCGSRGTCSKTRTTGCPPSSHPALSTTSSVDTLQGAGEGGHGYRHVRGMDHKATFARQLDPSEDRLAPRR